MRKLARGSASCRKLSFWEDQSLLQANRLNFARQQPIRGNRETTKQAGFLMSTHCSVNKLDSPAPYVVRRTVSNVVRPAYQGSSSYLVSAEDGSLYILKMSRVDKPHSLLFEEALGCELGNFFGLPMARWAVMDLGAEACDQFLKKRGQSTLSQNSLEPGSYFGSALPAGPEQFWEILPRRLAARYPDVLECFFRMDLFKLLVSRTRPTQYSVRWPREGLPPSICFFGNSGIFAVDPIGVPVRGHTVYLKGCAALGRERMDDLMLRCTSSEMHEFAAAMENLPAAWASEQERNAISSMLRRRQQALTSAWVSWRLPSVGLLGDIMQYSVPRRVPDAGQMT